MQGFGNTFRVCAVIKLTIAMAESWRDIVADGPVPSGKHEGVWLLGLPKLQRPADKSRSSVLLARLLRNSLGFWLRFLRKEYFKPP